MKELHDFDISYDQAFATFLQKIEDARREWYARVLNAYPFKAELEKVAEGLVVDLDANSVMVNSITSTEQTTVVKAPPGPLASVPVEESLCVIVVGAGEAAQVSDIKTDPFVGLHVVRNQSDIGSYASAPIKIDGADAGTICALAMHKRVWTDHEQRILEGTARRIGALVTDWADTADLSELL